MTMHVQTDRTLIRAAGGSDRYVLLSFAAPESPRAASRAPVNVALVIDRSGSMGGRKIELAREAVVKALQMLRATDRFSVVCYDQQVDVVVPSTLATAEALRNAVARVRELQPRGSTDLAGGWLKGCEQIAEHLQGDQIGRCLLTTDGLANHGITDPAVILDHARQLQRRGVTTSTFGVGTDFDERLLSEMATAGAGHFYFIETPAQIPDLLTSELGEALEVVARGVTVTVRATGGVQVATLNRYPIQAASDGSVVALGDVVSRQEVSLVFRLTFPPGAERATASALFKVEDAGAALGFPDTDIVWTYADHRINDAQPRNVLVDREVARLYAAKARDEALELNRAGRFDEAERRLESTARRIEQYAGHDPELRAIVEGLRHRVAAYSAPMPAMRVKEEHFASMNLAKSRDVTGKARRAPKA